MVLQLAQLTRKVRIGRMRPSSSSPPIHRLSCPLNCPHSASSPIGMSSPSPGVFQRVVDQHNHHCSRIRFCTHLQNMLARSRDVTWALMTNFRSDLEYPVSSYSLLVGQVQGCSSKIASDLNGKGRLRFRMPSFARRCCHKNNGLPGPRC